ncbi:MAG: glutamate-1-semialdehyde 2,1-aminomutase [Verrucomicrobium sp.]|nr:glutamate-1-semialdehyde 2,1-aminomutase [Verrucomicrobium sp.]
MTALPTPARPVAASRKLFAEALRYLPGGVNSPVRAFRGVGGEPFFAVRAEGARVWDADGNAYVDYVGTWGPAILGHAPKVVVEAVRNAAVHGTSFGIPNPLEVEMARTILSWVPSVEKVRMTNSGTEACMSAIRLARGFTKREKIVKFEGCYHGHGDSLLVKAGSGALTGGEPDSAGVPAALAALTLSLPFNDLPALEAAFAQNKGEIAAVIVEPFPANTGLILPDPGFHEALRRLCTEHGTLLIFDEVMTGFRLAKGGAQELLGIRPDLSTFGKVIGGGLPVGAFGGRAEVMDHLAPLGKVYQAGTLSGNPLAMAAGLAQLRALEETGGFAKLEEAGAALEAGLRPLLAKLATPTQLVRRGSMFSLFFTDGPVRSLADALRSDRERFARLFHALLDRGVYLAPSQFEAGFLSTAHGPAEIEQTLRAFAEALPLA